MPKPSTPDKAPEVSVKADGELLPDTFQVRRVRVESHVNKIPVCHLTLVAGNMMEDDQKLVNSKKLAPGTPIEVTAGYKDSSNTLFSGIILEQNLSLERGANFMLHIKAKDKAVKMTVGRKNATFLEKKDSDILKALIGDAGLTADVADTTVEYAQMIQYWSTDWDFLLARAEANGLVVRVSQGKVSVQPAEKAVGSPLEVTYGESVFSFDGQLNAQHQYAKVSAASWDVKKQELTTDNATPADAGAGDLTTKKLAEVLGVAEYHLAAPGFVEKAGLTAWAKGMGAKSSYAKVQGTIEIQGTPGLALGSKLKLKGFGDHFDGEVWVGGISHLLERGNWFTTCTMGLTPQPISEALPIEAPGATGQLPGIQGLHVGKVEKINEDEDGNFRVQVTLPLLQAEKPKLWARFATFYASEGVGTLFYPEKGDEVVVGFFGNDPRYPVVLGSLYSKGRAAPDEPDEDNNLKEIVTREKLKISFDEENKVLTATTPGENKLVLSDKEDEEGITVADQHGNIITMVEDKMELEEQNGNKITMNEDGLTLEDTHGNKIIMDKDGITLQTDKTVLAKGDKEITLKSKAINAKASQDLKAEGNNITLKAKTKLAGEGTNIELKGKAKLEAKAAQIALAGSAKLEAKAPMAEIKADAKLDVKGGAMATFEGGGMCMVKGALVKIN